MCASCCGVGIRSSVFLYPGSLTPGEYVNVLDSNRGQRPRLHIGRPLSIPQLRIVDPKRVREIGHVFLFLHDDLAQHLAQRELAHCVRLSDTFPIGLDGLDFVIEVELEHFLRFVGEFHGLGHRDRRAVEVIDLLGDLDGVIQFLAGVLLQFTGDGLELRTLHRLAVDDVGDDRLEFPGEVLIEQTDHFITADFIGVHKGRAPSAGAN